MATYDGEIQYSPQVAFDFKFIGEETVNDVVLDYLELFWCAYFAILFGMLGSELNRCASFVFQMQIFGFYTIWVQMRENPVFLDAYIFESFCRCVLSSILGSTIAAMFKVDDVVEMYTIATVGAGYFINLMDPTFRNAGECSGIGPPTPQFPHGVWLNCENWKMAYWVSWVNAFFKYLAVGIYIFFIRCLEKNEFIERMSTQLAVAMVATSSGVTFLRSLIRIEGIKDGGFDTFVGYSFYIFLGTSFVVQEIIHRARKCVKKQKKLESSVSLVDISLLADKQRSCIYRCFSRLCCWARAGGMFVVGVTMPMYWTDDALKWVIQRTIEINTQELKEEEEEENERLSDHSVLLEEIFNAQSESENSKLSSGPETQKDSSIEVLNIDEENKINEENH